MADDFEQTVVQNIALGATTLWSFCDAFFETTQQTRGPTLPETLLVLPIVLHERSATRLWRMRANSGLARALMDEPEIPAGLQKRMEGLFSLSSSSLALSVSSDLIRVDPDRPWPRYLPARQSLPAGLKPAGEETKRIHGAARRLGWWFADETIVSTASLLRVRF